MCLKREIIRSLWDYSEHRDPHCQLPGPNLGT
jgi:hypothetical protein